MEPKKQFVVSHPTGNTFVRALINKLYQNGQLNRFHTTIGFGSGRNKIIRKIFARRSYAIPDQKVTRHWTAEIIKLLSKGNQQKLRLLTDNSYKRLDEKTALNLHVNKADTLHAYEDGALESFQRAKALGIICSYEIPITHWSSSRRLLSEESERYPLWEPTLESTRESEEKLFRKDEELKLADLITCPSKFVLDSIPNEIKEKTPCQISPFGSPNTNSQLIKFRRNEQKALRLLFVGSMSQRKGLADVFEAMRLLKHAPVRLTILGRTSLPMHFYRKQFSDFDYIPPCSNQKVREVMQIHDALILPSIVEGRALVQQEALSCGLPIIVTPNAGGEDLVDEGITGYLVPIRSPEVIASKIEILLKRLNNLSEMRISCLEKAKCFTWHDYAKKIISFSENLDN